MGIPLYSNDCLEIIFESTNHLVKSCPTKTRPLLSHCQLFSSPTRVFYTKFLDYIPVTSSDVITSNFVGDESDRLLSPRDISKKLYERKRERKRDKKIYQGDHVFYWETCLPCRVDIRGEGRVGGGIS